jgi:hypothetical protein
MLKSIPVLAAIAMIAATATPATATEWITCSDATGAAQIGLLAGGLDFASFGRATLSVGDEDWSSSPELEPGEPLAIGQTFWDGRELIADLTYANSDVVLAELRVFTISGDNSDAKGGVLRVFRMGIWDVWPVACEGP